MTPTSGASSRRYASSPSSSRRCSSCFYWQELDIEALSAVFELLPGTVRGRIHRARKKLRELLELSEEQDESHVLEKIK